MLEGRETGLRERHALGALPRPDVPPGARGDLVGALHDLHHRAGWPSLRVLAREAGCSHTTVSAVFSSAKLPTWGVLELVVEALDGDVDELHQLWLAASAPPSAAPPVVRIAGRGPELAALRRHVRTGSGMLLVTGEAGVGKTGLVDAAVAAAPDAFVARGACLPLSTQVPLLPAIDALRSIYDLDHGQWLKEGMAECAPYVPAALCRLLPELEVAADPGAARDDSWWRQRLSPAVSSALSALAALRPLAVLVEDLHWADPTTLDLLEYLLARPALPLVGTYRTADPATPGATREWKARVQRLTAVSTLELGPLSREETAELVALLGASATAAEADRIHERSGGLPLFAEQLAAQPGPDEAMPGVLADLLDRRLDGIDDRAWPVARALGVADRPLTDALLAATTGLDAAGLDAGLRALDERRLLAAPAGDHDVRLRHPLLAEA